MRGMLVHPVSFEANGSLELIAECHWSSASMPGPWVLRTVLLLSITSVVVGFSFPANFGSVAHGYKGERFVHATTTNDVRLERPFLK